MKKNAQFAPPSSSSKSTSNLYSALHQLVSPDYPHPSPSPYLNQKALLLANAPSHQPSLPPHHVSGPKNPFTYPTHYREYSETSSMFDEQTGVLNESISNNMNLMPNKPNQENEIGGKQRFQLVYANMNLNNDDEMNSTIKENIVQSYPERSKALKESDRCRDNMQKRRMLFMRDQAEKKDLTDTSVNNTILDGLQNNESGFQSLNISASQRSPSKSNLPSHNQIFNEFNLNGGVRESSIQEIEGTDVEGEFESEELDRESELSEMSQVSQTWFQDEVDWHRQSQKIEKIVKWQVKCEQKFGFDPVEYFGGLVMEGESLENIRKDPRFSGKNYTLQYQLEMFAGTMETKEKQLIKAKEEMKMVSLEKNLDDISEDDLLKLIAFHKKYLELLKTEQEQVKPNGQIAKGQQIQMQKGVQQYEQKQVQKNSNIQILQYSSQNSEQKLKPNEASFNQSELHQKSQNSKSVQSSHHNQHSSILSSQKLNTLTQYIEEHTSQLNQDFLIDSNESPFTSYSKRETFANNNDPSFRENFTHIKGQSIVSNSTSEIKEQERILNIFNEGTTSSFCYRDESSQQDSKYIAHKPPLTERIGVPQNDNVEIYQGKINLFQMKKSNDGKRQESVNHSQSGSLLQSKQSRSESREKKAQQIQRQGSTNKLQGLVLSQSGNQRNMSILSQIQSQNSMRSDTISKQSPLTERSLNSAFNNPISQPTSSLSKNQQNFSSCGKTSSGSNTSHQNSLSHFSTSSNKKSNKKIKQQKLIKTPNLITNTSQTQANYDRQQLDKINKFYQNQTSSMKSRSKTPLTGIQPQISSSLSTLNHSSSKGKLQTITSNSNLLNLFQSVQHGDSQSQLLSARSQALTQQIMSQKNMTSQNKLRDISPKKGTNEYASLYSVNNLPANSQYNYQANHNQFNQNQKYSVQHSNQSQMSMGSNPFKQNTNESQQSLKSKPRGSQSNLKQRKTQSKDLKKMKTMTICDQNADALMNACEISFSNNQENLSQTQSRQMKSQAQSKERENYQIQNQMNQPQKCLLGKNLKMQKSQVVNQSLNAQHKGQYQMIYNTFIKNQLQQQQIRSLQVQSNEELSEGGEGYFRVDCENQINTMQSPYFSTTEKSDKFQSK